MRMTTRALHVLAALTLAGTIQQAHAQEREQLAMQLRYLQQQQSQIQQEFTAYAFGHKTATACAIATVGGPAVIFTQELDPGLRHALTGVSVVCGVYCLLADPAGCLDAAQTLLSAAVRYGQLEEKITTLRQQFQAAS